MLTLPPRFLRTISKFSVAFRKEVWVKAQLLLTGAILCPGSRTICNLLRTVGLQEDRCFAKYHRFLNQDKWSAKYLASQLLDLLVKAFIGNDEALVFGLDDTIERRWGSKINKRGIYRDPVRSSKSHFVKCSGLRWLSLMLLTPLPWLGKGVYWALPVLTTLCPSSRFYKTKVRQQKKLTDWARQIILWLARYAKHLKRMIYLTGDGSFATFDLFISGKNAGVHLIARMKLNARLFEFPPKDRPSNIPGPKPDIGERLKPMTDVLVDPATKWTKVIFSEWYGKKEKQMLVTSGVAIWYKSKTVMVEVKWVLIKDPEDKLDPVLLACTDTNLSVEKYRSFFCPKMESGSNFRRTSAPPRCRNSTPMVRFSY